MAEETELEKTLRAEIAASGKSCYALADAAKVNESGLGKFMAGKTIRSDTLGRLVAALHLEVRRKK